MAFEFFRRRQKMVIIVMVFLMVAFLISFQGFERIFEPNRAKQAVAHTRYGDLTHLDMDEATADVTLLERTGMYQAPTGDLLVRLLRNGQYEGRLAYALLLKEAEARGTLASPAAVDEFFAQIGLDTEHLRGMLPSEVREQQFRQAVQRWLSIVRLYYSSLESAPPSEPQLRHMFAALNERLSLQIAKIDAADLVAQVAEPQEQELLTQFERYRTAVAGVFPNFDSMGFGYRQPDRVSVSYLLIKREPLLRVLAPSEEDVRREYRLREKDFPPPATSQAASAPAPGVYRADMVRQITRELTDAAIDARIEAILRKIGQLQQAPVASASASAPAPMSYEAVKAALARQADEPGGPLTTVVNVKIDKQPLNRAIAALAKAAGLKGIAYPWGAHGKLTIDPDVKVSLDAKDMTLRDALAMVNQQVLSQPAKEASEDGQGASSHPTTAPITPAQARAAFNWLMLTEIPDVIFATPGEENVDMFPIVVGRSGLVDATQFEDMEALGEAATAVRGGQLLSDMVFHVQALAGSDPEALRHAIPVAKGEEGPRMYVRSGPLAGRLLWRLDDAIPAHDPAPDALTKDQAIRKQVIADVKLAKAMELAREKAAQLADRAKKLGLEAAAKVADADFSVTEPFTRMEVNLRNPALQELMIARLRAGMGISDLLSVQWNQVPGLALPSESLREVLMNKVFKLVPENPEPPYNPAPNLTDVQPVPPRHEVAVLHPTEYEPPVGPEFESRKAQIKDTLMGRQQLDQAESWAGIAGVRERTGYQPVKQ